MRVSSDGCLSGVGSLPWPAWSYPLALLGTSLLINRHFSRQFIVLLCPCVLLPPLNAIELECAEEAYSERNWNRLPLDLGVFESRVQSRSKRFFSVEVLLGKATAPPSISVDGDRTLRLTASSSSAMASLGRADAQVDGGLKGRGAIAAVDGCCKRCCLELPIQRPGTCHLLVTHRSREKRAQGERATAETK